MRLRREDDRLNLTAELERDAETGTVTITMTSQPMTGLSIEDFFGAALTIYYGGKPYQITTFTSVSGGYNQSANAAMITAQGFYTLYNGEPLNIISINHTEVNGIANETARIIPKT